MRDDDASQEARQQRLLLEAMMTERAALALAIDAVTNAALHAKGLKTTVASPPGARHLEPFIPAAHRILGDIAEQRRRLDALLDRGGESGEQSETR